MEVGSGSPGKCQKIVRAESASQWELYIIYSLMCRKPVADVGLGAYTEELASGGRRFSSQYSVHTVAESSSCPCSFVFLLRTDDQELVCTLLWNAQLAGR